MNKFKKTKKHLWFYIYLTLWELRMLNQRTIGKTKAMKRMDEKQGFLLVIFSYSETSYALWFDSNKTVNSFQRETKRRRLSKSYRFNLSERFPSRTCYRD